ncbi:L,D-transpeptidase [Paenibacillus daejeonensis]|uniref:L,D-transpeptidase n=1 Tax=Paenibacillus daejeonensis TaxID=135193 RepID=UPI00036C7A04|nr:L,D-transpeptidase [Paenibacillus daejeonensis]
MSQREEQIHLKHYVKQHPDNRMAWYLLGKEYTRLGKTAKANYCFIQAGDVYEAFEDKQHPLVQQQQEAIAQWIRRRKRRTIVRRLVATIIVLLGLTVLAPAKEELAAPEATMAEEELAGSGWTVAFVKEGDRDTMSGLLAGLLYGSGQPQSRAIAVSLEERDEYRLWQGKRRILMSAERSSSGGELDVKLHDAAACRCEPASSAEAEQELMNWSQRQEERWTLASAIHHYRESTGKWPSSLDELVRPYPANMISGETPGMRRMFDGLLQEMQTSAATDKDQAANNQSSPVQGRWLQALQLPEQPLRIVVDTEQYRLAVISGDVIVRSYAIGLGGDKTPTGSFTITEKVKNPNGRDNGEFGSRGMTLSNTLYAIHGTDEPSSIGKDLSLGCVRMGKADVEELYDLVPIGTTVTIQRGGLPGGPVQGGERFELTPRQDETNPGKVYRWLG